MMIEWDKSNVAASVPEPVMQERTREQQNCIWEVSPQVSSEEKKQRNGYSNQ